MTSRTTQGLLSSQRLFAIGAGLALFLLLSIPAIPAHATDFDDESFAECPVDLFVKKQILSGVTDGQAAVGATVVYKLIAKNRGTGDATGVVVSDTLPSGVTYVSDNGSGAYNSSTGQWTVGNLNSGTRKTLEITVTVNDSAAGTTVTNTADIDGNEADEGDAPNSASVSFTVPAPPTPTTFTVTASADANSTISPSGVSNVTSGADSPAFTWSANSGYQIYQVLIDGVASTTVTSPYTFLAVTANHTIAVTSTSTDTGTSTPAVCSDQQDNDGDGLIDSADPGCHTDGDAGNSGSYDPNDSSEVNESAPAPTTSGGGGGGGGWVPAIINRGQVLGTSTPQVLGESCGLYMEKHLRYGSSRNDTAQTLKLQIFLNKHMNAGLPTTGVFGPLTEKAVKNFQQKYIAEILAPWGIGAPTGIVYLSTLRQINLIECPELTISLPPLVEWSKNPAAQ